MQPRSREGHDPKKNPEEKHGEEGKPTPNHRVEKQRRHPAKTESRDLVEEWEEGPRKRGKRLPKGEKIERQRNWDIGRWREDGRSER